MNLKRFFAKDMRTALAEIKEELGSDAIIMSSKKVSGGIEIVAAVDYKVEDSDSLLASKNSSNDVENKSSDEGLSEDNVSISSFTQKLAQKVKNTVKKPADEKEKQEKFADSLAALLARQEKQSTPRPTKEPEKSAPTSLGSRGVFKNYAANDKNSGKADTNKTENRQNSVISDAKFNDLSKEVEAIRKLLQFQLAGLMNDQRNRDEPIKAMITRLMVSGGFSDNIASKLANKISDESSFNTAWQEMARILENNITVGTDSIMKNGGAVALIGPTGVGKTTTLAKLAARFALKYGSDQVALISTDHYRIGAQEQLQTYGRIMGCVVKVVEDISTLADVLYSLRHKSLVLIDTAGFGQRDVRLEQELSELEKNAKVKLQHYLVLSGTSQRRVLEDAYSRFSPVGIDGLILTKLDESLALGDIADLCISKDLPLSYITTGQRVPEDIEVANSALFVQRLMSQLESDEPSLSNTIIKTGNDDRANWAKALENTD